jgi:hypothetical protein
MKELSLHILDILQNSIEAKANLIEIYIIESLKEDIYQICVKDNGVGMSKEMLSKVTDPYCTSRTTRKVGLGIPLFKQIAELAEGSFNIESEPNKGTTLVAKFRHSNIDRPILGDIAGVIVFTAASNENIRFIYKHNTDAGEYIFDTKEIKEAIDGVSLNQPKIIRFLKEMINENLLTIKYSK